MSEQRNLVFIWTDQQAAGTMAAYGNDRIDTPNLNALAAESAVFQNAYASTPVCSPSRSCVMTGKYPHASGVIENNVPLPLDENCLPEIDGFEEYTSCYIGKWHLGDEVFAQHGFDEWVSTEAYRSHWRDSRDRSAVPDYYEYLTEQGYDPDGMQDRQFSTDLPEEHSKPAFMARKARQFIRDHRDEPFILHVMFLEPHGPFNSPRDDRYDPDDVELPPNFDHDGLEEQPLKARLGRALLEENGLLALAESDGTASEEMFRTFISNYWGLVSLVDTYTGTILDELEEQGLADETVTVYTSDHGEMLGGHRLQNKGFMFEEAITVPLLLRVPGLTDGGVEVERPVSHIDLLSSVIDAMNRPVPEYLRSGSWLPSLRGDGPLPRGAVVVEWNGPNGAGRKGRHSAGVRRHEQLLDEDALEIWTEITDRETALEVMTEPVRTVISPDGWKLTRRRSGECELYNLSDDPYEMNDLADDPPDGDIIDDLSSRIFEWQREFSDPVYF